MIPEQNNQYRQELIEAILSIEDPNVASDFFLDLCSSNEVILMEQRFAVAKMLYQNLTYQEIAEKTGASTATISRVSRALNSDRQGYIRVIKGMENNAKAQ